MNSDYEFDRTSFLRDYNCICSDNSLWKYYKSHSSIEYGWIFNMDFEKNNYKLSTHTLCSNLFSIENLFLELMGRLSLDNSQDKSIIGRNSIKKCSDVIKELYQAIRKTYKYEKFKDTNSLYNSDKVKDVIPMLDQILHYWNGSTLKKVGKKSYIILNNIDYSCIKNNNYLKEIWEKK